MNLHSAKETSATWESQLWPHYKLYLGNHLLLIKWLNKQSLRHPLFFCLPRLPSNTSSWRTTRPDKLQLKLKLIKPGLYLQPDLQSTQITAHSADQTEVFALASNSLPTWGHRPTFQREIQPLIRRCWWPFSSVPGWTISSISLHLDLRPEYHKLKRCFVYINQTLLR